MATRSFLTDADRRLGDDARGSASDAPAHFGPGRETVDELPLERLVVPAVRLDVRALVGGNPGFTLSSEHVEELERAEGRVPAGNALLVCTGWDAFVSDPGRYGAAGTSKDS